MLSGVCRGLSVRSCHLFMQLCRRAGYPSTRFVPGVCARSVLVSVFIYACMMHLFDAGRAVSVPLGIQVITPPYNCGGGG
jgi:hypothetical protein